MIDVLAFLLRLATDMLRSRAALVAENTLLRQQLVLALRGAPLVVMQTAEHWDGQHPPDELGGTRDRLVLGWCWARAWCGRASL